MLQEFIYCATIASLLLPGMYHSLLLLRYMHIFWSVKAIHSLKQCAIKIKSLAKMQKPSFRMELSVLGLQNYHYNQLFYLILNQPLLFIFFLLLFVIY